MSTLSPQQTISLQTLIATATLNLKESYPKDMESSFLTLTKGLFGDELPVAALVSELASNSADFSIACNELHDAQFGNTMEDDEVDDTYDSHELAKREYENTLDEITTYLDKNTIEYGVEELAAA